MANPWEQDRIVNDTPSSSAKPWETDKILEGNTPTAKPVDDDPLRYKEVDKDPYRVKEAWTALKTAGKGVPILGNYITEDDSMKQYKEDNPWTAKGLEVAGGMTSMIPAVKGVQIASKAAPILKHLAAQMGIYGGIGAGLGAADTATNPDAQEGDMKSNAITGGITGMFGPLAGKLLSPRALPTAKPTARAPDPHTKVRGSDPLLGDPAHRMGPLGKATDEFIDKVVAGASAKAREKVINAEMPAWVKSLDRASEYSKKIAPGTRMLASSLLAGGGLFGGAGVIPAAAIGSLPYTVPAAIKGVRRASMASWANKPIKGTNLTTKDIINAMALQQAGNTGE